MKRNLKSHHQEKPYRIGRHPSGSGWVVTRPSGSTVKISESIVKRTRGRLESGEAIPYRKISYTVAIETGCLAVLQSQGLDIESDDLDRVYRLTK
jgi:hypothetical protein